jgi:hypothetical protein
MVDDDFIELVRAFEVEVGAALNTFLVRSGLAHPLQWREAGLEREGVLSGSPSVAYVFHGAGLWLRIDSEEIDFDFGFDGRTGGFNEWWLAKFVEQRPSRFPRFQDPDLLRMALSEAEEEGTISKLYEVRQDSLFYLTRRAPRRRSFGVNRPRPK